MLASKAQQHSGIDAKKSVDTARNGDTKNTRAPRLISKNKVELSASRKHLVAPSYTIDEHSTKPSLITPSHASHSHALATKKSQPKVALHSVSTQPLTAQANKTHPTHKRNRHAPENSVTAPGKKNVMRRPYNNKCNKKKRQETQNHMHINSINYSLTPLATGGICDIYLATPQREPGPRLTVKMLKPEFKASTHVRRQFAFEAQILRDLNHRDLPKYVASGQRQDNSFLAYAHIPGRSLMSYAQQKQYYGQASALSNNLRIIMCVLNQIYYLHTKPGAIVHGDISAENVIISPDGTAHLTDFGCAHLRHAPAADSHRWIGKPSYVSPEQAQGKPWSASSDIYQIGILSYELVVGKRWHSGETFKEKMLQASNKSSPSPDFIKDIIKDHAPDGLSRWIARCLTASPELRPASAADLISQLNQMIP